MRLISKITNHFNSQSTGFIYLLTVSKLFHFSNGFSTNQTRTMGDTTKLNDNYLEKLKEDFKCLAPNLSLPTNYKGQSGKIGIFGGSLEYTGAPYFAGISALKVGADLVHIFCTREAAIPIKCYSPDLIVHPLLESGHFDKIKPWLDRFDVIVVGPGLGRTAEVFELIEMVLAYLKAQKKPVIIDADGLFLITSKPELLNGFNSPVILTPNKMELARLLGLNKVSELVGKNVSDFLLQQKWSGHVTIFSKGAEDEVITESKHVVLKGLEGSGRRCGGQGDILAGSLAVFLHWACDFDEDKVFIASYAAANLVRSCNVIAFTNKGRSFTAVDMIDAIHTVFDELFEQH